MLAVVVAEGVAVALLAVLVLGLLRSHALIHRALHELGAGLELEEQAAPDAPPGPVPVRLEPGVVPASRAVPTTSGRPWTARRCGWTSRAKVGGPCWRSCPAGAACAGTSGRSCPRARSTYTK